MRLSELIQVLQQIGEQRGDLRILIARKIGRHEGIALGDFLAVAPGRFSCSVVQIRPTEGESAPSIGIEPGHQEDLLVLYMEE
jgi:hypothetical protein